MRTLIYKNSILTALIDSIFKSLYQSNVNMQIQGEFFFFFLSQRLFLSAPFSRQPWNALATILFHFVKLRIPHSEPCWKTNYFKQKLAECTLTLKPWVRLFKKSWTVPITVFPLATLCFHVCISAQKFPLPNFVNKFARSTSFQNLRRRASIFFASPNEELLTKDHISSNHHFWTKMGKQSRLGEKPKHSVVQHLIPKFTHPLSSQANTSGRDAWENWIQGVALER